MVTYNSTRGSDKGLTFLETIQMGLATDGGLMVPNEIPQVPLSKLLEWKDFSFAELSFQIMSLYIDESEISGPDLKDLIDRSYAVDPKNFRDKSVAPVSDFAQSSECWTQGDMTLLELFHGPTFAFKDIALQFLGNLFEYIYKTSEAAEQMTVVAATSGDTGSSAIYGLRGRDGVQCYILFPEGRVSEVQERQMTTVLDNNIHNIAIKGTFDDGQGIVKSLFRDLSFKKEFNLMAVNSINWARILAQIVYYFYAYFQLLKQRGKDPYETAVFSEDNTVQLGLEIHKKVGENWIEIDKVEKSPQNDHPLKVHDKITSINGVRVSAELEMDSIPEKFRVRPLVLGKDPLKVNFSVPTGNFGDVLAGFYAKQMGLPIDQLIVATNQNNILDRFFSSGGYDKEPVIPTITPSMDIVISSNFERFLYWVSGNNSGLLKDWMNGFEETGKLTLPEEYYHKAKAEMTSFTVAEDAILTCMKTADSNFNYLLDPHTAVGVVAANEYDSTKEKKKNGWNIPTITVATAHPGKFPDAVKKAFGPNFKQPLPSELSSLFTLRTKKSILDADVEVIRKAIETGNGLNEGPASCRAGACSLM